jgi:pimeloyl-ACP methyl ester carboxylesterase
MEISTHIQGKGEPIIFIHGAGGNASIWHYQAEFLKSSMKVVPVDLPGHGRSKGNGYNTIEGYRDSIHRMVEELNLRDAYLAGHSMGGAIAMSYALSYPAMVKGLILIGTGARLKVVPAILDGVLRDKKKAVEMIAEMVLSKHTPVSLREVISGEIGLCDKEVIHGDFSACDRFDMMETIRDLATPTLIICGNDDMLTPPKYARFLHESIGGSVLVTVDRAGHMVMVERPEAVNMAIGDFVGI